MLVGDKVSYSAVSEAYCLLSSYIREEGKVGAKYNLEQLQELVTFLAEILKHPENFTDEIKTKRVRLPDGSVENPEHDGRGLA
jgi:hypothetical protein